MSVNKMQAGYPTGVRWLWARIHAKSGFGNRKPGAQVAPVPEQIERFPRAGFCTKEFGGNQKICGLSMLGITRGSEENSGFGSRGCGTRITNVSGEQFGVDTRGFGRRVVVSLRRSNVWGHEIVVYVGTGKNFRGCGPAWRGERARRYIPNEELDEDTRKEGGKQVNPGELTFAGRLLGLLRGNQGLVFAPVRSVVALGVLTLLDILGISGAHNSGFKVEDRGDAA